MPVAADKQPCLEPVRYGFRSFDRQWIIPDNRLINRPNPKLWSLRSATQIYLTAPSDRTPTNGPALTFSAEIPDLHHYNGRGGRAFPLWLDTEAAASNLRPTLLSFLTQKYGQSVRPEDFFAYIAGVAANPAFTFRFQSDLSTPGLRLPLTASSELFSEAAEIGRTVIWLHTFGERMADLKKSLPPGPPRLRKGEAPMIPKAGAIPTDSGQMPNTMGYDAEKHRLLVGQGYVENVSPKVWAYEVSGKQVLTQWFSYRRADRERPIIGDRRQPSPLGDIQPAEWLPEYSAELINLLNVLELLVRLEPKQAELLGRICDGPLISLADLQSAGALDRPAKPVRPEEQKAASLFPH